MKKNTKIIIAVITLLMLVVTGAYSLLTGNDTATNGTVIVTREQLKKVVSISATLLSEDEPLLTKTYTTDDISAELTFEDGTTREAGLVSGIQGEVLTLENGKTAYRIDFLNANSTSYIDTEYTINHTDTIEVGFTPDNNTPGVVFGAEDYSGGAQNIYSVWMPSTDNWKPLYQYGSSDTVRNFQLTNGQEYIVRVKFGNNYNVALYKNEVSEESLIDTYSNTSSNRTLTANTLYLGARHTPEASRLYPFKGTISYMKITDENGKTVRDLIPVVDEDGNYAFYDKAIKKTYYSMTETPFMGSHTLEEAIEYSYVPELVVSREGNQLTVSLNPVVYDYELSTVVELPKLVNIDVELLNNQRITPGAKFVPTDFNLTTVYDNGKSYSVPAVNPYTLTDGTEVTPIEYIYADKIAVPVGEINFDRKTYLELDLEMLEASDYARMMGFYGGSSNCCNLFNIEFASYTSANVFPGRYALNVGDYRNRNLYTVSYADQQVKTLDPHTRNLLYVVQTNYSWTTQNQMFYLKGGGDKTTYGTGKIYGFKYVYDNVTLMDLMPVKITDEQYGLYNKITQEMVFTMGANVNHGALKNSDMVNYDVTPYIISNNTTEIRFDLNSELYGDGVYTTYPIEVVTIESIAVEKTSTVPAYVGVEYDTNDFEVKIVYSDGSEEVVDSNKYTISPSVIAEDTTEITVTLLSEYFGEEMTITYAVTPLLAQNVYLIGSPVANKAVGVLTEDKKLTLYGKGDFKPYSSTTTTDWYNERETIENVEIIGKFTPTNVAYLFSALQKATSITGLENFDMTYTTDWSYLFGNYGGMALTKLEGIETWNPKALITTARMFQGCNKLSVVDLSSLDTSSLTSAYEMMNRGSGISNGIASITAAYVKTQADADKLNGMDRIHYTNWVAKPEGSNFMIGRTDGSAIWNSSVYSVITEIEIVNSIPEDLSSYTVYDLSISSKEPVKAWINGTKMYIGANGKITTPTSMTYFFSQFQKATSITGLENFDMTYTTDWSYLFGNYGGMALTKLEGIETWNPKALITTARMFQGCNKLSVVDLSSLDTSSLTSAYEMMNRGSGISNGIASITAAYVKTQADADKLNGMDRIHYTNWTIKTITSFDLNGGTGTIPNSIVSPPNKTLNLPTPEASNNDLVFKGWSIYPDNYSGKMTYTTSVESPNTTLYAIWMPEGTEYYNITLNLNYPDSPTEIVQVAKGYKINDNIPKPERTGYIFKGWADLAVEGEYIATSYIPTQDMTIYAQWMPTTYSITYNLDGGNIAETAKTTYTIEDADYTLEIPTKEGYRFSGWDTISYASRTTVLPTGSTGNKTYVAKWEALQPEGTLNDNSFFKEILTENQNDIVSVVFEETIPENVNDYKVVDFSYNFDRSVLGWIDDTKTLHIGSTLGKVKAYDVHHLFDLITFVERVDVSKLDINGATNMQSMFGGMTNVRYINMSGLDLSNITTAPWMFYNDNNLETIVWEPNFSSLTDIRSMFGNCYKLTADFKVYPSISNYSSALGSVSTNAGQFTLKYTELYKNLATNIYNTKNSKSNVVMEHFDNAYTVTTDGSEYDYIEIPTELYENTVIELMNKKDGYIVKSYELNGNLVEGNILTMPSEDIQITNINILPFTLIETSHNYTNNMDLILGTWDYSSANGVKIILDYRTEGGYDYFRMMNSDGTEYIKTDGTTTTNVTSYGGNQTHVEFITSVTSGKIHFHSDGSGVYWGVRAIIMPADNDITNRSITIIDNPGVSLSNNNLENVIPYKEIKLTSNNANKMVSSFELNGITQIGDVFVMPNEDVTITNIVVEDIENVYTLVNYVESDGNQYIDTGYIPNENTKIEIKWLSTDYNGQQAIVGSNWSGDAMLLNIQSNVWHFHANGQRAITPSLIVPDVISYSSAANSFVVNGITYNNSKDSLSSAKNSLKIFGLPNGFNSKGKLYYLTISEGDNIVRKYLPAVRKTDNAVGIFDMINKEFFVSETSTQLIGGSKKYSITITNPAEMSVLASNENPYEGEVVYLLPEDEWYGVETFDINGISQTGNSFVMPSEDVEITNIVLKNYEDEYYEIEYVEANGNQYVDTGYIPNHETKVEFKYLTSNTNEQAVIGSAWNGNAMLINIQDRKYKFYGNGIASMAPSPTTPDTISYSPKPSTFTVNGTVYNNIGDNLTNATSSLKVFGIEGSYRASGKLYSLTISENEKIVRKFIPAERKTDAVVGLFDAITKQFVTSATDTALIGSPVRHYATIINTNDVAVNLSKSELYTGDEIRLISDDYNYLIESFDVNGVNHVGDTFIMPDEDVEITNIVLKQLPEIYQVLEYLESNGSQEVDTGIPENEAYAIQLDFMPLPLTNTWQSYMGGKDENFTIGSEKATTAIYHVRRGVVITPIPVSDTERNSYVIESNGSSLGTTDNTIRIFGNATTPSRRSAMRFYYALIKDLDGNIVRRLVPVMRLEDGELGLYDIISGQFFTSITGTSLIAPPQASAETMSLFSEQSEEENVSSLESENLEGENVNNEVTNNEITNNETIENEVVDNNALKNEIVVDNEENDSKESSVENNTEPVVGSTETTGSENAPAVVENATAEENAEPINETENSSETVENVETNKSVEEITQE